MKKFFKIFLWVIVIVIFIGTFVYLFNNSRDKAIEYELMSPQIGDIQKTSVLTGKIEPRDEIEIKPQISGIIAEINVEPGDEVKEGDVIARIKVIPDESSLSSAQSRVYVAELDLQEKEQIYERTKALYEKKFESREKYEQDYTGYCRAKQELESAKDQLSIVKDGVSNTNAQQSNTLVRATITGLVLEVPVKVGSSVIQANTMNDGTTIAKVADMNNLLFKGKIDETEVGLLSEGMDMNISVGALPELNLDAVIEKISPIATEENGANTFELKAAIGSYDGHKLRAGYSANATVILSRVDSVLTIPEAVIEYSADSTFVYLAEEGENIIFTRIPVELGMSDGVNVELKSKNLTIDDKLRGYEKSNFRPAKVVVKYFSALLFVSVSFNASAEKWTLNRCIDYALEHNLDIKMREQNVDDGELQISSSRNSFLPQVNANASQSFNFGRGLSADNTYANRNTSNFSWGASISVPLFSGLRNIRTLEQAKLNLKQITWQLEQARDNVTLNVISQYLQVLYNKEVTKTSLAQVELSENELARRKSMAEDGRIAEVEVYEAESQLAQDRLSLVNAENDYKLSLLELTQMLQLSNTEDFEVVEIEGDEPMLPDANTVYIQALENNNSVKAAEAGIEVAKSGIAVAQSGYIPTLSFNGGIGSSYYKLNGVDNMPFKKQMRENYNTYIGFSLNVPIFDGLSTRTNVKRARVQYVTSKLQSDQVKSDLYKAIQQAHLQATGSQERYNAARTSCEAAEISFVAMREKYNLGRATSTEYEQSKTKFYNQQIQKLQSRYEYLLRYRILQFYQGYRHTIE